MILGDLMAETKINKVMVTLNNTQICRVLANFELFGSGF